MITTVPVYFSFIAFNHSVLFYCVKELYLVLKFTGSLLEGAADEGYVVCKLFAVCWELHPSAGGNISNIYPVYLSRAISKIKINRTFYWIDLVEIHTVNTAFLCSLHVGQWLFLETPCKLNMYKKLCQFSKIRQHLNPLAAQKLGPRQMYEPFVFYSLLSCSQVSLTYWLPQNNRCHLICSYV